MSRYRQTITGRIHNGCNSQHTSRKTPSDVTSITPFGGMIMAIATTVEISPKSLCEYNYVGCNNDQLINKSSIETTIKQ